MTCILNNLKIIGYCTMFSSSRASKFQIIPISFQRRVAYISREVVSALLSTSYRTQNNASIQVSLIKAFCSVSLLQGFHSPGLSKDFEK